MKRILVCLDASARASFVLQTAADLARRASAKLHLLRTVGLPPEIDEEMFVHAAEPILQTLTKKAEKELDELARDVPPELLEGKSVRVGTPWDQICTAAKALDCDLVVIGSHGYSGFDKILGTTAGKVVNHCDRSVLVARPTPR
ncbi:MAG: universal stress protein [Labilithrix sp.]|nr:universal stress protein [Labilithrix sp.]